MSVSTTLNIREVSQFTKLADEWWDEGGAFAPLHRMNLVRIPIIRRWSGGVAGKSVLDVGCGGGIVCEPLARLGAKVTGIDGGHENIEAARVHAASVGLDIDYRACLVEDCTGQYDVVLALEIIEHVESPALFLEHLARLTKPGGIIILSTLNRTPKSFALGKVAAEYILRWLPKGTHDWKKFKKPSEISAGLKPHGVRVCDITGMAYDLKAKDFKESKDTDVNYFMCAVKSDSVKVER